MTGGDIIRIALGWTGTPYRHQGSLKGVGCDCLGLVRGVWRDLYGNEPQATPAYGLDWNETSGGDPLMEAAWRHFIPTDEPRPGDLLLFRWRSHLPAKHCGILLGEDRFLHAYERHAVMASPLVPHWRRKIAGQFRFPPRQTTG